MLYIYTMKQTQKTKAMKTAIDTQKEKVQMLIESANGGFFTIKFNKPTVISGLGVIAEYYNGAYEVTSNKLEQLKAQYTWTTNF